MTKKGYKQSEEQKEKRRNFMLGKQYTLGKHWKESKECIERKSKAQIKYMMKNSFKYVSSWEDKFVLLCLSKCFPARFIKQQYRLKGLTHAFDIALPKFKILIEIDGNYFHSFHTERDAEVNEFLWRTYPSWSLFRFDDSDLKSLNLI